jgi:hypothetical protein
LKTANLMSGKVSRGEMFELLRLSIQPLHQKLDAMGRAMTFLPYHAIVLSLIIERLGITDEEIAAHREKCAAEQAATDAAAVQAQAEVQQTLNDGPSTGQA